MPTLSSSALLKQKMLPRQALQLIANFRNVPESVTERGIPGNLWLLSDVLAKALQKKYKQNAKAMLLENLRDHWQSWFLGTDFSVGLPERIDRWSCLWIKAPNAILCQKLQFKNEVLLKTLNALINTPLKNVRWFV